MTHIIIEGISGVWIPDEQTLSGRPEDYLSPHFRESEFTCNHCNSLDGLTVPQALLAVLEDVRTYFGNAPVTINSGYRCKMHNTNVGGATNSRHMHADAADITVAHTSPNDVMNYLDAKYPDKYGVGNYGSFTHIDVRPGGPARW